MKNGTFYPKKNKVPVGYESILCIKLSLILFSFSGKKDKTNIFHCVSLRFIQCRFISLVTVYNILFTILVDEIK